MINGKSLMKQFTIIIVCAMLCISASVVSTNIFVPALPKAFFIKEYNFRHEAIDGYKALSKTGWQNIKITLSTNHVSQPSVIVTAEKY